MKVKVGDTVYDSKEEPILLILSPVDRLNIIAMPPNISKLVSFPDGSNVRLIAQWMAEVPVFAMDEQSGGEG